jgi:hypothetical protein
MHLHHLLFQNDLTVFHTVWEVKYGCGSKSTSKAEKHLQNHHSDIAKQICLENALESFKSSEKKKVGPMDKFARAAGPTSTIYQETYQYDFFFFSLQECCKCLY